MRQRITIGGISAAALAGLLLLWVGMGTKPVSAMEQMAENVRKVNSVKWTVTNVQTPPRSAAGTPPSKIVLMQTVYWQAPGSLRTELAASAQNEGKPWQEPKITYILPDGKPGIRLRSRDKTYRRWYWPYSRHSGSSAFERPEDFARLSDGADRPLGTKEIGGRAVSGFEIDVKKIEADNPWSGPVEVWLDSRSKLPVLVHAELKHTNYSASLTMTDFQWNIDLGQTVFDATPPQGYRDDTPAPPASAEELGLIVDSLRIYAEASGGHYPRHDYIDDLTAYDLRRLLGVKEDDNGKTDGTAGKVVKATRGFSRINDMEDYNSGVAYYGKAVGPGDKNKVLLRWKRDDGQYAVIFGDLHHETVTPPRLHTLEAR